MILYHFLTSENLNKKYFSKSYIRDGPQIRTSTPKFPYLRQARAERPCLVENNYLDLLILPLEEFALSFLSGVLGANTHLEGRGWEWRAIKGMEEIGETRKVRQKK